MDCLLPIWHKEIFIPVRLLEDYSDEALQSTIAVAIESWKTHHEQEEQFDHDSSESEDDYEWIMNPTKVKIVSNNFLQALPECPPIHRPSQTLNDPKICFCPCSLLPNHGGKKRKYQFTLIMGARPRTWLPCNFWIGRFYSQGNIVYLNKLATFQWGPARHIPSKGVSGSLFFLHEFIYCMNSFFHKWFFLKTYYVWINIFSQIYLLQKLRILT